MAIGRSELAGMDETPVRDGFVDTAAPFAQHLGFTVAQRMVRRRIDLPLDDEHRGRAAAQPQGHASLTTGPTSISMTAASSAVAVSTRRLGSKRSTRRSGT